MLALNPNGAEQHQHQHLLNNQLQQQQQQRQPYTLMHMPQHFQLVQRPGTALQSLLQSQQAQLAALGAQPPHLNNELLSNILANVNGASSASGVSNR